MPNALTELESFVANTGQKLASDSLATPIGGYLTEVDSNEKIIKHRLLNDWFSLLLQVLWQLQYHFMVSLPLSNFSYNLLVLLDCSIYDCKSCIFTRLVSMTVEAFSVGYILRTLSSTVKCKNQTKAPALAFSLKKIYHNLLPLTSPNSDNVLLCPFLPLLPVKALFVE